MKNQTCFDLNAAIANWQQELAAQSNLTPEVRRELETHLRDAIAELRQLSLNDEESFWLARRRVGQPQQLGEEFEKAMNADMSTSRDRDFMEKNINRKKRIAGILAFFLIAVISSPRAITQIIVFSTLFTVIFGVLFLGKKMNILKS